MGITRTEEIDALMAPIHRITDAYIDFIVMVEQNCPGSVQLRIPYAPALLASNRIHVRVFMYFGMSLLVDVVIKLSGYLTFDALYVRFRIGEKIGPKPELSELQPSMIYHYIDTDFRKETEDGLLLTQPSLALKDVCGIVHIGQALCNHFGDKIDDKYRVIVNEFRDCLIDLATIVINHDNTNKLAIVEDLITALKPFHVDQKSEMVQIINGTQALSG